MNCIKRLISLAAVSVCAPFAHAAGFAEGVIEGMPDVLVLNRISTLELAKAPDSLMYRVAAKYLYDDMSFWQRPSDYQNSAISVDRDSHVTLKPLLLNAPISGTPGWAQCPPNFATIQTREK